MLPAIFGNSAHLHGRRARYCSAHDGQGGHGQATRLVALALAGGPRRVCQEPPAGCESAPFLASSLLAPDVSLLFGRGSLLIPCAFTACHGVSPQPAVPGLNLPRNKSCPLALSCQRCPCHKRVLEVVFGTSRSVKQT